MDNIRASTSSAARNIAETVNPSDSTRGSNDKKDLKEDEQALPSIRNQLDRAAFNHVTEGEKEESTLQKGSGTPKQSKSSHDQDQKSKGEEGELHSEAEPKRPEHDLQIEEFLKEHYKSASKSNASDVEPSGERG